MALKHLLSPALLLASSALAFRAADGSVLGCGTESPIDSHPIEARDMLEIEDISKRADGRKFNVGIFIHIVSENKTEITVWLHSHYAFFKQRPMDGDSILMII